MVERIKMLFILTLSLSFILTAHTQLYNNGPEQHCEICSVDFSHDSQQAEDQNNSEDDEKVLYSFVTPNQLELKSRSDYWNHQNIFPGYKGLPERPPRG